MSCFQAVRPADVVTLGIDVSVVPPRLWDSASCPSAPASGYQAVRLGTASKNSAFEVTQDAIRVLHSGHLTGAVQTQQGGHALIGSGPALSVRQGCRRVSLCGACIDGFTQVESTSSLATFRMDVRAGQLLRVLLVPHEFDDGAGVASVSIRK